MRTLHTTVVQLTLTIALYTAFSLTSAWGSGISNGTGRDPNRVCHPHVSGQACQSMLAEEAVASGTIPQVHQRLPQQPRRVAFDSPGSFSGRLTILSSSLSSSDFLRNATQRLIEFDAASKSFVPNVASSYQHVSEGQVVVTLRDGHRWSNGNLFTAADVIYSQIVERHHGRIRHEFTIAQSNDITLNISCSCSSNDLLLAIASLQLYPQHWSDNVQKPDGNQFPSVLEETESIEFPTLRPWVLESKDGELYTFRRNFYFHTTDSNDNQLPYLDGVVIEMVDENTRLLRLFSSSSDDDTILQVSVPLSDYEDIISDAQERGYRVDTQDIGLGNFLSFSFNYTHEDPQLRQLFLDIRFRRAMSLAIHRQEIVSTLSDLVEPWVLPVTHQWTGISAVVDSTQLEINDPRDMLLSINGMSERADGHLLYEGRPLTFDLVVWARYSKVQDIAEIVAAMWEDVGVTVELTTMVSAQDFCGSTGAGLHHAAAASLNFGEFASTVTYPFYITAPFYTLDCPLGALGWSAYWRKSRMGDPPDGFPNELFEVAEQWTRVDRWEQAEGEWILTDRYQTAAQELAYQSASGLYTIGTVTWPPRLFVRSRRLVTNGSVSSGTWVAPP